MQNGLQQWAAAYLQSSDQGEPFLFGKVREVIRGMQQEGKLKEIIFGQLFMLIQTLKVLNATNEHFQLRIKKILALLYPDNAYVTQLVLQVNEMANKTQRHVQARGGFQNVQRVVKRGPPAGKSIC